MENWNDIFLKSKCNSESNKRITNIAFSKPQSNKNKSELAIKLFNEGFDEFNLEKSNALITEIKKQLMLDAKEFKQFNSAIRKKMSSLGISLDDLS